MVYSALRLGVEIGVLVLELTMIVRLAIPPAAVHHASKLHSS